LLWVHAKKECSCRGLVTSLVSALHDLGRKLAAIFHPDLPAVFHAMAPGGVKDARLFFISEVPCSVITYQRCVIAGFKP
jgi:hypothetical protein